MGDSASPYKLARYQPAYRTRWTAFARAHGTVFHSLEWKEALEETFGYRDLSVMVLDDRDTLVGLLPLFAVRTLTFQRVGVSVPFAAHVDICGATAASGSSCSRSYRPSSVATAWAASSCG